MKGKILFGAGILLTVFIIFLIAICGGSTADKIVTQEELKNTVTTITCEVNDVNCNEDFAKEELIDDIESLSEFGYNVSIEGVDASFEKDVTERTIKVKITRKDIKELVVERKLKLTRGKISIQLTPESLTSKYGEEKKIEYTMSPVIDVKLEFTLGGLVFDESDKELFQYLPVIGEFVTYAITVKDPTGCYDVEIVGINYHTLYPAEVEIEDSMEAKYYYG